MDATGVFYTHQSHSVTTAGEGSWAQVGWLYYPGNQPLQYWEYQNTSGDRDLDYIGSQSWGTTIKYQVSHTGGQTWCVWVGGIQKLCFPNTDLAPNKMIAQSEVHHDPNTRIATQFTEISLKKASGNWELASVSLSDMHRNFPYNYTTTIGSSSFSTWRRSTTDRFIPLITECDVCYANP